MIGTRVLQYKLKKIDWGVKMKVVDFDGIDEYIETPQLSKEFKKSRKAFLNAKKSRKIKKYQKIIIEHGVLYWCYRFAREIKKADKKALKKIYKRKENKCIKK